VDMPGTPILPTYNTEEIKANTVLVASASTTFTDASSSGRAKNIKKMCEMLSGSVVMPGEEFSVNDTAGARSLANGWFLAKGIENGVYTDQPGGGICQVSSTMYNSLLKADLEITSRRPHSIPSSYIKRALDAAISTGGPDLKFKNNTEWPVYLILRVDESAGTSKGTNKKVIIEVYGRPLPDGMSIKLESKDITVTPFDPLDVVYVTDPDLVRNGRNRYVTEAWKVYLDRDGKEIKRVRANTSTYGSSKPYMLEPVSPTPDPNATPTAPAISPTPAP
jgi:vancomycin resistance protein YoaR